MNLAELLSSEVAALPKPAREEPFRPALRGALDAYLAAVDRLDPADPPSEGVLAARDVIAKASDTVLAALEASLHGQASRARGAIDGVITALRSYLDTLRPVPDPHVTVPGEDGVQREVLFRMRVVDVYDDIDRGGIFHVPFDRRHQVGAKRYSVPGVPMLYLATSLYTCWLELGRPPLDRVWVSAFRVRSPEPLPTLNFGIRPAAIGASLAGTPAPEFARYATAYAVAWPLIAACEFRAKHRGAPFVEEYVIPQLLMSWVAEREEFAGMRYFSTHVRLPETSVAGTNVVLPARDAGDDGHCEILAGRLELTAPVSWAHTEAVNDRSPAYINDTPAQLRNGEGRLVPYFQSVFGYMEARLKTYPFTPLAREPGPGSRL